MSRSEIPQMQKLEAAIYQNPEIKVGVDAYGNISISKGLPLSDEEKRNGWLEKEQRLEFMFNHEPPEVNSLILQLQISFSEQFKRGNASCCDFRYSYDPNRNTYSDVEEAPSKDELDELKAMGFKVEEVEEMLNIGGKKLQAALELPVQSRIWDMVYIAPSFLKSARDKIDNVEEDRDKLVVGGLPDEKIKKLLGQDSLSPLSQVEIALDWIRQVQSGEVRLTF